MWKQHCCCQCFSTYRGNQIRNENHPGIKAIKLCHTYFGWGSKMTLNTQMKHLYTKSDHRSTGASIICSDRQRLPSISGQCLSHCSLLGPFNYIEPGTFCFHKRYSTSEPQPHFRATISSQCDKMSLLSHNIPVQCYKIPQHS